MMAKAQACHTASTTMAVHAHSGLVRMLSRNAGMLARILGSELENMY
ncbi:Uncharacterised protein [Mycobacteroides abscessus subsp. abscessus]|nr:Uncharacterised protein [Mycobacteroides abscessus subsp. abscessus]